MLIREKKLAISNKSLKEARFVGDLMKPACCNDLEWQ